MPIFTFKCYQCKHAFEKILPNNDELMLCPDCRGICATIPSVTAYRRDHTVLELVKK